MELGNLIKSRRSIRSWQDREVPEQLLIQAIELATWAPNAGNKQNWRFYVIVNRDIINTIADAVQASTDQIASWPEADESRETFTSYQKRAAFFRDAPVAIAVAAGKYQSLADQILAIREKIDPQAGKMRQWRKTANSSIQSVASAIAYLLLILHNMGLGAVWMNGPIQAKGTIENILGVSPEMDLIAFIPVGYPAESPPIKERRPIEEVCEVVR